MEIPTPSPVAVISHLEHDFGSKICLSWKENLQQLVMNLNDKQMVNLKKTFVPSDSEKIHSIHPLSMAAN